MSGLDALDALRERRAARATPPWERAPFAPTYTGRVLAFDPSLSSTGWAFMSAEFPWVLATGVISTDPLDGEEGNLQRGVSIFQQVRDLIKGERITPEARYPLLVAHEAPPAGGSGLFRTDAIKSAALAIRIAADTQGVPVHMVSDHHAKKRLVGRSKDVAKRDTKAALEEFWGHLPLPGHRWNADIRDAVSVGIITLEEYRHAP